MKRMAAAALVVPAFAIAITGCSGQASSPSSSSASELGGSGMLPPIPVNQGGPVEAKVGNYLNVITPGVGKVTTDNAKVLDVSQPYNDGSATFNGGARVISVGKAKLTVYNDSGTVLYVADVTATQ